MEERPKPGDRFLDQVCPDASPEERERMREHLAEFAKALAAMGRAIRREELFEKSRKDTEEVPEVT